MELIVLVDKNMAIGKENDLLVRIKADLQRFRDVTEGQIVVYGRKTLETFPGQKILPDRENWIMSRNSAFQCEGAQIFHDKTDLLKAAAEAETAGRKVFIIGGASIYRTFYDVCETAHVTELDKAYPNADAFIPDIKNDPSWQRTWESDVMEAGKKNIIHYRWVRYDRVKG